VSGSDSIGFVSNQVELAGGSLRAAASHVRFPATRRARSVTRWRRDATRSRAAGTRRGTAASASLGAAFERPAAGQRTAAWANARRRDNCGNLGQLAGSGWKRVGADRRRGVSARRRPHRTRQRDDFHAEFTREIATHAGPAITHLRLDFRSSIDCCRSTLCASSDAHAHGRQHVRGRSCTRVARNGWHTPRISGVRPRRHRGRVVTLAGSLTRRDARSSAGGSAEGEQDR
jgi:hypothetical protein